MEIYYFVYETLNLVNGKKYRGIHKTSNLNDGYLGSGVAFEKAVNVHGKSNFRREVLEFCSSYEELIEKEKIYVDDVWVSDRSNYNLKTGGQSAGILSDFSKKKISETLKRKYKSGEIKSPFSNNKGTPISDEQKKKISETLKERYRNNPHNNLGVDPWNKNKKGSQTAWNKGLKTGPNSIESNEKRSKTLKEIYENMEHPSKGKEPWNKGKIGSQIAWNKGKIMDKIEYPHCHNFYDTLNAKKWHFDNCKLKIIK